MLESPDNQTNFNTQLPYIHDLDSIRGHDSTYIDFVYDTLNVKPHDKTFVFQLKEIVLPVQDTIKKAEEKPSIIFPYKTKPVAIVPKTREITDFDWLTGLFLLCLVILVWIRYEGERRVSALFRAVFARHNMNQLLRDGDIIHERLTPGLMLIYLISFSTLLMIILRRFLSEFIWTDNTFILFSGLFSAALFLWALKIIAIRVTGKIFRTRVETEEYLITNIIFNVATGLVSLPFVFAAHYADNEISMVIAIAIFILGILFRFIRSIFVGLSAQTFPVVYLFLYLCTLEILPFLVLYKILAV